MTIFLFSGGINWHLRTAPPGEGPSLLKGKLVVHHTTKTGRNVSYPT
jgi:hypothetical protein